MANAPEIREKLGSLLSHQMSLDDFEEWFAPYSWNIHKNGDAEAQKLAYAIEHQLSTFDDDSAELRNELLRVYGSATAHNLQPGDARPIFQQGVVGGSYGSREESHAELSNAA